MAEGITVREARREDTDALGRIYFLAVNEGAANHYTDEERRAWAPAAPSGRSWAGRLKGLTTLVAEHDGVPVGFMSLRDDGYLDLVFVLPEWRRRGAADALYAVLESRARAGGMKWLGTEASRMARPFFLRHGWRELSAQKVKIRGVWLENFRMDKRLAPAPED